MLLKPVFLAIWIVDQMLSHWMMICTVRTTPSWLLAYNIASINCWKISSHHNWLRITLWSEVSIYCAPHLPAGMYMSIWKLHSMMCSHWNRLLLTTKDITMRHTKFNSLSPLAWEWWLSFESTCWHGDSTFTILRGWVIRIVYVDDNVIINCSWAVFTVL